MGQVFRVTNTRSSALRALNYTPEIEAFRQRGQGARSLGDLAVEVGPAYGTVFTRLDCEADHGIELLSQADMFRSEPEGRIIRRDSMRFPERHLVRKWQILMAGAGTLGKTEIYGRSILADSTLSGKYVGPDAVTLTFAEPGSDENLFTYAFLCSKIGVRAIRSTSYGTKILRYRSDLLRGLPIPLPGSSQQRDIAELVRKSVAAREAYIDGLRSAQRVIEQLPIMQKALVSCQERQRRTLVWSGQMNTICAWNYASTGNAITMLGKRWKAQLGDILETDGIFNGPRFARIPCDSSHGIDFMSQRDVFMRRPVLAHIRRPEISDRQLFVPQNAILAGSHGQLNDGSIFGSVELAEFGAYRCGVTQDILRILTRPEHRNTAYVFLSTTVGRRLLQSTAVGTSIPSVRLDLARRLPFPELTRDQKRLLDEHLETAIKERQRSQRAETEAVRLVEEEVIPQWLS